MPNCYTCRHSLTCFMRIELTRTIQSFKLLADTQREAQNTESTAIVDDIYTTVASACSAWAAKTNAEVSVSGVPYKVSAASILEAKCSHCGNHTAVQGNPSLCSLCLTQKELTND